MAFSCSAIGAEAASTPRNLHIAAHSSSLELSFASKLKDGKDSPPSYVMEEECNEDQHVTYLCMWIL